MPMTGNAKRPWVCLLIALMLLIMAPAGAKAQSAPDLARKVDQLERQVRALQRQVFSGDSRYFATENEGAAAAPTPTGAGGNALAELQVRVAALEERLRSLTGQIEEAGYQSRQLTEQMRLFREDMEFRLGRLEQGGAAPASGAPPNGALAAPGALPSSGAPAGGQAGAPPLIPSQPAATGDPRKEFEAAFAQMSRGDYGAAERGFKAFLEKYPKDSLASNVQYWLGRTYLVQKDYPKAAAAFFAGQRDFPQGAKAAENLLGLASALFELQQKDDACGALDLMRSSYPDASSELMQRAAAERARIGCK
jgi:tol-pal system protein YbgF